MEITSIAKKTREILESKGIKSPYSVSKRDFTTFTFIIKDPITEEKLKKYEFTENEFYKIDYSKKEKLKKLEKIIFFNEKEYFKAVEKEKKISSNYKKEYKKEYHKIINQKNITEKQIKIFTKIMENFYDYFDFENYTNQENTRIEFETGMLSAIGVN